VGNNGTMGLEVRLDRVCERGDLGVEELDVAQDPAINTARWAVNRTPSNASTNASCLTFSLPLARLASLGSR
jgi:hypothetical protein